MNTKTECKCSIVNDYVCGIHSNAQNTKLSFFCSCNGCRNYPTLNKARKSARWNCTIAPQLCGCHGCQLDKAGR